MATPHVSGVAALLVAHEARLNNIEIKNRLIATAKGYPQLRSKVKSGGVVNAYNSLTNQQAPPDPNDPANWNKANSTVSSSHPYKNKSSETYNVKVNGAKEIALYFSKFDTEANYDFVEIYDGKGNLVDKLSGVLDDSYSAVISGDSAKIILKSDDSLTKYGFDITHAAWR
jgi:subtilisin family serine protease